MFISILIVLILIVVLIHYLYPVINDMNWNVILNSISNWIIKIKKLFK